MLYNCMSRSAIGTLKRMAFHTKQVLGDFQAIPSALHLCTESGKGQ